MCIQKQQTSQSTYTVDGSEIRRSPLEVGSFSHYLQGFLLPKWFSRRISEPSTVAGKNGTKVQLGWTPAKLASCDIFWGAECLEKRKLKNPTKSLV